VDKIADFKLAAMSAMLAVPALFLSGLFIVLFFSGRGGVIWAVK